MADRYNTPERGTTDWHEPLNENFDALDRDVELRDTESHLADYSPRTGAKFLATDTGAVYLGDGSEWRSVGSVRQSDALSTQMTTYGGGLAEYELFRLPGEGVRYHVDALSAATLGGGDPDPRATLRVYAGSTDSTPVAAVDANGATYDVDATFENGEDLVLTLDTSDASEDVTLSLSLHYGRR